MKGKGGKLRMENREKYLSFVVPCYNSESYMARCIESLLPGGEDVEIIIIDDGSKDKTGCISKTISGSCESDT